MNYVSVFDNQKAREKKPEKESGCEFSMEDYDKIRDEKIEIAISLMPSPEVL